MRNFRMKLDPVNTERWILESVNRVFGCRRDHEVLRHSRYMIAVTHPDIHFLRQPNKQATGRIYDLKARVAILSAVRRLNGPPKFVRDQLQAVTDSQDLSMAIAQQIVSKPGRGVII